jgi:hypothetical protein
MNHTIETEEWIRELPLVGEHEIAAAAIAADKIPLANLRPPRAADSTAPSSVSAQAEVSS